MLISSKSGIFLNSRFISSVTVLSAGLMADSEIAGWIRTLTGDGLQMR